MPHPCKCKQIKDPPKNEDMPVHKKPDQLPVENIIFLQDENIVEQSVYQSPNPCKSNKPAK
jgi:hypothetical protein